MSRKNVAAHFDHNSGQDVKLILQKAASSPQSQIGNSFHRFSLLGFVDGYAGHCATTPPSERAADYVPKQPFAMHFNGQEIPPPLQKLLLSLGGGSGTPYMGRQ